jgi:uncharacterized secreted protein with C-terminal beta-propeller domain
MTNQNNFNKNKVKTKQNKYVVLAVTIFAIFSLIAIMIAIGLYKINQNFEQKKKEGTFGVSLKNFSSCEDFVANVKKVRNNLNTGFYPLLPRFDSNFAPSVNQASGEFGKQGAVEFSTTTNQVAGVDEPDIVKTNGKYIFSVVDDQFPVYDFRTGQQSAIPSTIKVASIGDDGVLNKIGQIFISNGLVVEPSLHLTGKYLILNYKTNFSNLETIIKVFEVSEQNMELLASGGQPRLLQSFEYSGEVVSSRLADGALHFVLNKNSFELGSTSFESQQIETYLPQYSKVNLDGSVNLNTKKPIVSCDKVKYTGPIRKLESFTTILSFDTANIQSEPKAEVIYGGGEVVYMSPQALYLAQNGFSNVSQNVFEANSLVVNIFKFDLRNKQAVFRTQGQVKGNILNQYSMDEFEGNFRIATTIETTSTRPETGSPVDIFGVSNPVRTNSKNSVYVLDKDLKPLGSVENLGINERIYSVRFMGNRGFVTTFRKTDPLYSLDLSDPRNPKKTGELKTLGYSDFLYPINESRLLGIGRQADENGNELGVKISLFDVSNPNIITEKDFVEFVGNFSTTEVSYNPKAFMFDPRNGIFAFPINKIDNTGDFQGSYFYKVRNDKIEFFGRTTHKYLADGSLRPFDGDLFNKNLEQSKEQIVGKPYPYDMVFGIKRQIYINNGYYTISPLVIVGNDVADFQPFTEIQFSL